MPKPRRGGALAAALSTSSDTWQRTGNKDMNPEFRSVSPTPQTLTPITCNHPKLLPTESQNPRVPAILADLIHCSSKQTCVEKLSSFCRILWGWIRNVEHGAQRATVLMERKSIHHGKPWRDMPGEALMVLSFGGIHVKRGKP